MRQILDFADSRQLAWCVHCGGALETRDHLPSKVLLDDPFPENLPVVLSCRSCNSGLGSDEEYFTCLIECLRIGSTELGSLGRQKIKRLLARAPALRKKIEISLAGYTEELDSRTEFARVKAVVLKHARGHTAFDMNDPHRGMPTFLTIRPLHQMSVAERQAFEMPEVVFELWPEVGSRMMQRILSGEIDAGGWIHVQAGRYRYAAGIDRGIRVRMVFSEYLCCDVRWEWDADQSAGM